MVISIRKIRRSHDCLVFMIEIPIPMKNRLYIVTCPEMLPPPSTNIKANPKLILLRILDCITKTPKLFCCSVWKLDLSRCSVYTALQGTTNTLVSRTPQCTSPIPHNAPVCNRNVHRCAHCCYKMVHCGMFVMRCGVCEMAPFILLFTVHSTTGNTRLILLLCLHCITGADKLILSVCLYCITGQIGLILLRSLHFITENRNHYAGPFALHYM